MAEVHHTLADRTIVTATGCIEWTAARNKKGYGILRSEGACRLAHRISYERSVAPIPKGMQVLHCCDNPPCINPDHFFLGTNNDNVQDSVKKGRRRGAVGEKNQGCKLTPDLVLKIRVDRRIRRIVAAEYQISEALVSKIRSRRVWGHLP